MRAAKLHGARDFRIANVPVPSDPGPGEVIVQADQKDVWRPAQILTAIKTARRWAYDVKGIAENKAEIVVGLTDKQARTVTANQLIDHMRSSLKGSEEVEITVNPPSVTSSVAEPVASAVSSTMLSRGEVESATVDPSSVVQEHARAP